MQPVSRALLARAGKQGALTPEAAKAALDISGLRPSRIEWRDFGILAMRLAGVLSLAAGVIFLVAFNWQNLSIWARFIAIELPLLVAVALAWWKGVDAPAGKLALLLAVLLTGALLALFGQTYQTGANVYELFFGWAALTLPWVVACCYAPCWAIWLLLVNLGIGLYSGASGPNLVFGILFGHRHGSPWSFPFLVDLLLYITILRLSAWPEFGLDARWLRRSVIAAAMAFGTCAMIYRITGSHSGSEDSSAAAVFDVLLYLVASVAVAVYAYRQRDDLFNFAVVALSWVAVTTTLLARALFEDHGDVGSLFILGMYLIGASTAAVKGISYISRQWNTEEAR